MDLSTIHYCRECRKSRPSLETLKASFREASENIRGATENEMAVLKKFVWNEQVGSEEDHRTLAKMAVDAGKQWSNGRVLTVAFIGGSRAVKERVIRHAQTWMEYANIDFDFKERNKTADIRISFRKNSGSWSCVGTELKLEKPTDPTMNFGWLTATLDDIEFGRVVLHEFGHALGCIHEHERPDNGIPWDKPKVYAYYYRTNKWKKAEVDAQVFELYDSDLIRASLLDKDSIMMYPVPNSITIGDFEIPWNSYLSAEDKKFIRRMYPGR